MANKFAVAVPVLNLTLAAAQEAVAAGTKAAQALGIPMSIVVVDRGGQLKAAANMDGTTALPFQVALRKAWTSAVTGSPTEGVFSFISMDKGSAVSMPHLENFSVIAGGLPVMADGACVGGIGVSGATAELDLKVAEAAAAALKA